MSLCRRFGGWSLRVVRGWAVPHGAGIFTGVAAGLVVAPTVGEYGVLVGAGGWLAVSAAVYMSSLLDTNSRGWHDKAAGTIVVSESAADLAPDSQRP